MAISVPTATSLKLKFPEFNSVADGVVEFAIEEAQLEVDDSWIDDAHSSLGILYLAAHHLMVTLARGESGTGLLVKSESFAGMSVSYDTEQQSKPDPGDYTSTPYGSRFLELVAKNQPPIMLI
jgi:hypothetical protein